MPFEKISQPPDTIYEDIEIPVPVVIVNKAPSPKNEPLPPAVVHPVKANSDYEEIDPPPKPLVTTNSNTVEGHDSVNADEVNSQEPMYAVVKKPSQQAATAASHVTHVVESASSEQLPNEAYGYQIERINDSVKELAAEVSTPPRTEEMDILVENNSDSESYDSL